MIAAVITWAVLATCGALAVYVLMRRENQALDRMGYGQYSRAEKLAGELAYMQGKAQDWATSYCQMREMYLEQWQALNRIKSQRHLSAKHARQVQLQRQRQAVLEKAGEMVA